MNGTRGDTTLRSRSVEKKTKRFGRHPRIERGYRKTGVGFNPTEDIDGRFLAGEGESKTNKSGAAAPDEAAHIGGIDGAVAKGEQEGQGIRSMACRRMSSGFKYVCESAEQIES